MAITYELIATAALDSNSVTISSIPSTYTDLKVVMYVKSSAGYNCGLRFNGDSTSGNYLTVSNGAVNSTPNLAPSNGSSTYWDVSNGMTPSGANDFSVWVADIFSYSSTSFYKQSVGVFGAQDFNGGGFGAFLGGNVWKNTAAINSITFVFPSGGGPSSGSTISLYGIKAA